MGESGWKKCGKGVEKYTEKNGKNFSDDEQSFSCCKHILESFVCYQSVAISCGHFRRGDLVLKKGLICQKLIDKKKG